MDMMNIHPDDKRRKDLKNVPPNVPMAMLSEEWAKRNHGQTLARLNERGGLDCSEILDNIHQRRLGFIGTTQADVDELYQLIADFYERQDKEG